MTDFYNEKEILQTSEYGIEFFALQHKDRGDVVRTQVHPAIEFIYVTGGRYEIGVEQNTFIAERGALLLFRSNVIHTLKHISENGGVGHYYVLKINPTLLFQIFTGKDTSGCVIPFIHKSSEDVSFFPAESIPEETKKILEDMIAEHARSDKFFYASERAYAVRLLISLLRTVIKPKSSIDDGEISERNVALIHESVEFINENYASDITPNQCAASIHLSYSYFAKLFRAVMGKTFKEYLTSVRLAKAHNILISTSLPITDVAASCGYSNLSYFISEYRKIYGKTPREARKENTEKSR